ncbi:MAG: hypothetical protein V1817_02975 [Candidatus Micrarchaeota archaeon]
MSSVVQKFLESIKAMGEKPRSLELIVKDYGTEIKFVHENPDKRKLIMKNIKTLVQQLIDRKKWKLHVEARSMHRELGSKIIVSGDATCATLLKLQMREHADLLKNEKKSVFTIVFK